MSNGWIPTTERLPDQREFIEACEIWILGGDSMIRGKRTCSRGAVV